VTRIIDHFDNLFCAKRIIPTATEGLEELNE
jgi:hypothetical protein